VPIQQELLNGGVVTARDASLLKEGELTQADDCILRPRSPAIWKAGGRVAMNSKPSGATGEVTGLRHLTFDNYTDALIANVGAVLYTTPYTDTGLSPDWTAKSSGYTAQTAVDYLDVVSYGAAHYVLNAQNRTQRVYYATPQELVINCTITGLVVAAVGAPNAPFIGVVVGQKVTGSLISGTATVTAITSYQSITLDKGTNGTAVLTFLTTPVLAMRPSGMTPVSALPSNFLATTTGVWPTTPGLGAGLYWFLYTEMYMPGVIDDVANGFMESGFTTAPSSISVVTPASTGIVVSHGNTLNTTAYGFVNATHWQVYMSGPTNTLPSLSTFQRVGGVVSLGTASITLTSTLSSLTGVPTTQEAMGSSFSAGWPANTNTWDSPTGAYTYGDGTYARGSDNVTRSLMLGSFTNMATGTNTVTGISLYITAASVPEHATLIVQVGTASATKVSSQYRHFLYNNSIQGFYIGGASDTLNPTFGSSAAPWVQNDTPNLVVALTVAIRGPNQDPRSIYVDSITMTVHFANAVVDKNGVFFRTVTLTSQAGVAIAASAALPPTFSNTGDIFDGQLVVNDYKAPAIIRYSLPDQPEYFPALYYINFESKAKDVVTCIKRVNNALVVGLRSSIKRINYLPRESDAEFDRGRCQEDVTTDHGIVGPQAATLFTMPGMGTMLAYVSAKGLHITDGNSSRELNTDLDWDTTVNTGVDSSLIPYLKRCMLVNYASEYALRLAYVPAGGTTVTKYLQFSYHPMHVKDGQLPAMGPCSMNARSFCPAVLNGMPRLLSGHPTDGNVYVEDVGTTSADTAALPAPAIKTRLLLPRGIGGQGRIQRVYFRVGAHGDGTLAAANAGDPPTTSATGTGRLTVGSYRQNINEASIAAAPVTGLSTTIGGTVVAHVDSFGEGLILTINKPATATSAMRIDMIAYQVEDGGQESHRS
jgi:hypothetical protein